MGKRRWKVEFFLIGSAPFVLAALLQSAASSVCAGLGLEDQVLPTLVLFEAMVWIVFGAWYYIEVSRSRNIVENMQKLKKKPYLFPLLAVACQYITVLWKTAAGELFPQKMREYQELMRTAGMDEKNIPLLMGIYTVFLAAVGEELIFRGMTMTLFRRSGCGFWIANILQAVLFGMFHLDFIQGVYAFVIGIIVGCVVEWYGTLSAGIVLHICFNFIGTYLNQYLPGI